jgi:hypothetical protein
VCEKISVTRPANDREKRLGPSFCFHPYEGHVGLYVGIQICTIGLCSLAALHASHTIATTTFHFLLCRGVQYCTIYRIILSLRVLDMTSISLGGRSRTDDRDVDPDVIIPSITKPPTITSMLGASSSSSSSSSSSITILLLLNY